MKPIFLSFAALLIIAQFGLAGAEQVINTNDAGSVSVDEPSMAPDSFFWGFKDFFDKVSISLTFNDKAKAEKGLQIANERLSEFEKMAREGKVDAAQKAKKSYDDYISTARAAAAGITDNNKTKEIEQQVEIEKEVENQENRIEKVKIKIETRGNLTAEQKALINSLIASMQNQTGSLKIKIEQNKEKIKIEIKQRTNKSEIEIESEIEDIEERHNITSEKKLEKAREEINDAREELAKLEAKIAANNVTDNAVLTLRDNAKAKIAEAENAYNSAKFGEAYGLANAAGELAENAKEKIEKLEEKENKHDGNKTRNETEDDDNRVCIQVITPARNEKTGKCKEFPTPCDVPEGWEAVNTCTNTNATASFTEHKLTVNPEAPFDLINETFQNEARCKEQNTSIVAGGCILQNITYDKAYLIKLDSRTTDECNATRTYRFMAIKLGETKVTTFGTCDYNRIYEIKVK